MVQHQQDSRTQRRGGHLADHPPSTSRYRRAVTQVLLLTAVVAVALAVIYVLIPNRGVPHIQGPWWIWVLASVMFGVAEYGVFNVYFRWQGMSFTLTEIPMAIALTFLSPSLAMLARIPIALLVFVYLRRNQPYKLLFNLALVMFETALAIFVFRRILLAAPDTDTSVVLALVVTLLIIMPIATVLVSMAVSRFEGRFRQRVRDELATTWWLYPVNVVLAVMVVALMLVEAWLGFLALLPAAGLWVVLHSYGQMTQELRDLDLAHGFAGRIGRSLAVGEIADTAVVEMTSAFRAGGAALVRFDTDAPAAHCHGDLRIELPERPDEAGWSQLIDEGPRLVSAADAYELRITEDPTIPSMLVTPVGDDSGLIALALVAHAGSYGRAFGRADVARLRNMAQQLGVSLRRGILHERLEYEARHDALTDLPARRLFERSVERVIAEGSAEIDVVLMIDLDRFKEVNDTLGHHAGDNLLIEFSRRILAVLEPDDQLARLAGDEFAILARRGDHDGVAELARRIVKVAGEPMVFDGIEIVVTASVGVAEIIESDDDAVEPMRRADIAMYNAKWQRTGVELYRNEIDRRTPARLSMLGDLRAAIESNQLRVVYQPKVDLTDGTVVGAEALVRWEHAKRGIVAPTEFVRVAEDTGLIKDLTDLVLGCCIADLRMFEREQLGLAVNLSTRDLFDARLPARVSEYLDTHGVAPDSLTLEITESSLLVDVPRTRTTIDELHAVGLRLAIDDFGTGYSSLSYLRRLPVDELKIDQSFVVGMEHDPQDDVIVRSTVDLGHNLGLRVVAEGVESRPILERLRAMGCDVGQGFEIAAPMTASELIVWVRAERRSPGRFLPARSVG